MLVLLIVLLLLATVPICMAVLSDKGIINYKKYIKQTPAKVLPNTPEKRGKNVYKKLSGLGKFVWFGMAASIWMLRTGMKNIYNYDFEASIVHYLVLVGFMLLIVFFICAFFDDIYCEYKYEPDKDGGLFSVSGRVSRSEFFCYFLVFVAAIIIIGITFPVESFYDECVRLLVLLPFQISFLTAAIRRSQDFGGNAWLPFIPLLNLFLWFAPSEKSDNEYGPCPTTKKDNQKDIRVTRSQRTKIESIKVDIVNNHSYISMRKKSRIEYLNKLRNQVSTELSKQHKELEKENNKLNDVPTDIAKYVKPKDTSMLKHNISELENKIIAIDELIKSETVQPQEIGQPFEWWK